MTVSSLLPLVSRVFPASLSPNSSRREPQCRIDSYGHLLPHASTGSDVRSVKQEGRGQIVEHFPYVCRGVGGGRDRLSIRKLPALNSFKFSYCNNTVDNGRRPDLLFGTVGAALDTRGILGAGGLDKFESGKSGSEFAIANGENGSATHGSGVVVERKETLWFREGEGGLWSVVIPTYNRLPILLKCLQALEDQKDYLLGGIERYEVIVVDDGSTDGTVEYLRNGNSNTATSSNLGRSNQEDSIHEEGQGYFMVQQSERFPHVRIIKQKHGGATKARNLGLKHAKGAVIVFIDSDLVVTDSFLRAHGEALREAFLESGDDRAFTYGRVVNTSNFENPQSEKFKITDYSAAFFATGNVAISHRRLLEAGMLLGCHADGPFDAEFSEYGWEDLELGVRLRQCGARIKHAPAAIGYHWHPAFSVEQLPKLIEQERQRGRNGVRFYRKHPTLNVRLMIQMTLFHEILWFLLTLGGMLNERSLEPILRQLVLGGRHTIAAALVSPILNWHTVQAVKDESKKLNVG